MRSNLNKFWNSERSLEKLLGILAAATGFLLIAFSLLYYHDHYLFLGKSSPLDESLQALKQHVSAHPSDPSLRMQLAALYYERGSYDQAIQQAQLVLDEDPQYQDALYLVGLAHLQSGKPRRGLPFLEEFAALRQESSLWQTDLQLEGAYYFMGTAYLQVGEADAARQALEGALMIDKTDADAHFLLGEVYAELSQVEQTIEHDLAAIGLVPDFEMAYRSLGQVYDAAGDPAGTAFAEAGMAYCRKDYLEALEKLSYSLQVQPDFSPAWVLRGLSYEASGDLDRARQALVTALDLDPQNFLARHVLGRLDAGLEKAVD